MSDVPAAAAGGVTREPDLRPSMIVLAVLLATTFGGYLVAALLSEPQGAPVSIPGLVSVQPLSGWSASIAQPESGAAVPLLTRGGGNLAVFGAPGFTGTPAALAAEYERSNLSGSLDRLSVSNDLRAVTAAGGLPAVRFGYTGFTSRGTGVQGEVTVVVGPGGGVVFDGRASGDLLPFTTGDIHAMIAQARMTG